MLSDHLHNLGHFQNLVYMCVKEYMLHMHIQGQGRMLPILLYHFKSYSFVIGYLAYPGARLMDNKLQ